MDTAWGHVTFLLRTHTPLYHCNQITPSLNCSAIPYHHKPFEILFFEEKHEQRRLQKWIVRRRSGPAFALERGVPLALLSNTQYSACTYWYTGRVKESGEKSLWDWIWQIHFPFLLISNITKCVLQNRRQPSGRTETFSSPLVCLSQSPMPTISRHLRSTCCNF